VLPEGLRQDQAIAAQRLLLLEALAAPTPPRGG
jgi:hypothetical protein